MTVKIFALNYLTKKETTGTPVQTIVLKVPDGTFPMPQLSTDPKGWSWYTNGYAAGGGTAGRMKTINGNLTLFHNLLQLDANVADVVRGLLIGSGDYRLTAGRPLIDDSTTTSPVFEKHPKWDSETTMVAALGPNMGADKYVKSMVFYADGGGSFVSAHRTRLMLGSARASFYAVQSDQRRNPHRTLIPARRCFRRSVHQ